MQHISVVRTRLFGRLQIENRYTPPPRNVQSLASRKRVIMVMAACSKPAKAVMTPRELKAEMRRERLALRDAIAPEERAEKSLAMVRHAADAVRLQPGEIVSGFWPIRSEVDVRPLMFALARTRRAALPAGRSSTRRRSSFASWCAARRWSRWVSARSARAPEAEVLDPDVMLVPLAAFDRTRPSHRLWRRPLRPRHRRLEQGAGRRD